VPAGVAGYEACSECGLAGARPPNAQLWLYKSDFCPEETS